MGKGVEAALAAAYLEGLYDELARECTPAESRRRALLARVLRAPVPGRLDAQPPQAAARERRPHGGLAAGRPLKKAERPSQWGQGAEGEGQGETTLGGSFGPLPAGVRLPDPRPRVSVFDRLLVFLPSTVF